MDRSSTGADRIGYREAAGNRAGGQLCCDEGAIESKWATLSRKKFTETKNYRKPVRRSARNIRMNLTAKA